MRIFSAGMSQNDIQKIYRIVQCSKNIFKCDKNFKIYKKTKFLFKELISV